MSRRQHPLLWIAALLAIAIGTLWQQRDRTEKAQSLPTEAQKPAQALPTQAPKPADVQKPVQSPNIDELVGDAEERAELRKTLDLIARGGPFPYRSDGAVFANRERRLPQRQRGYYREYTVVTPRARDRGPRRIVRGNGGEMYYTRDHYRTFARIE